MSEEPKDTDSLIRKIVHALGDTENAEMHANMMLTIVAPLVAARERARCVDVYERYTRDDSDTREEVITQMLDSSYREKTPLYEAIQQLRQNMPEQTPPSLL